MKKKAQIRIMYALMLAVILLAVAVYAGSTVQIGDDNLTVNDSTDAAGMFNQQLVSIIANYSNATSGIEIADADCTLNISGDLPNTTYPLPYNSTTELYNLSAYFDVGVRSYNISCNKTGHHWLNVTDMMNISNRNPVYGSHLNITIIEDNYNDTNNLNDYFSDPDYHPTISPNHLIGWNYTAVQNLTITIDNSTGIINVTPDANWYGERNVTIYAIDPFNATNHTNITVSVINKPEISLTYPQNGSDSFYANTSIAFKAQVGDDYDIQSCSLYINESLNDTISNPNVDSSDEAKNDTGNANTPVPITSTPIIKQLTLTNTNYSTLKVYLFSNNPSSNLVVKINNNNILNITPSEVSGFAWVTKQFNNSMLVIGNNNISLEYPNYGVSDYYGTYRDENNRYLIRLSNDIVEFSPRTLSKGDWNWSVECTNNQSESKNTDAWLFTVKNKRPNTPTSLTPTSGTFNEEINITCNGSTDIDEDSITYSVEYADNISLNNWKEVYAGRTGTYIWNTSNVPGTSIRFRCKSNDGYNDSPYYMPVATYDVDIHHPNSPTAPTSIMCNQGTCAGQTFGGEINISCSGSTDNDSSSFNYTITSYYEEWNGSEWHTLASVPASQGNQGNGNFTWNTNSIMNQTGVKIGCYADDGSSIQSKQKEETSITIAHNSPSIPSNLNPQGGYFDKEINVSCNGSTGQGTLTYEIYAYYKSDFGGDEEWYIVNNSLSESDVYNWSTENIPEQTIDLRCRAHNGTHYSNFYNPNGEPEIKRPPTTPSILDPQSNTNHEYELNYSCSGSNNSNNFSYKIDAYYDSGSGASWTTLQQNFPGIMAVNDSEMAYEDGTFDYISQSAMSIPSTRNLELNVLKGNFSYCITGYGTGAGPKFKLMWGCSSGGQTNCIGSNSWQQFISTLTTYCTDIVLSTSGLNYLQIQTAGDNSLGTIETYIDHAYLVAKPKSVNVQDFPRQTGINFTCFAKDESGNSPTISSENITIDRIPKFNTSESFPVPGGTDVNDAYRITLDEGKTLSNHFNLNDYFYDEDGDSLSYSVTGNSRTAITINQTTGNVTIRAGSVNSDTSETVTFHADDNLTAGDSPAITITIRNTGGSSGGDEVPTTVITTPDKVTLPTPTPDDGDNEEETEEPPVVEQPKDTGGSKNNKTVIESSVIQKVYDTKVKHTREWYVSRTRTRIVERIKNVGFYDLQDILVRITIPKAIVEEAVDIIGIEQFTVIEDDPVIGYEISTLPFDSEIEISYIIEERLRGYEVDQIHLEVTPRPLTPEEIAEQEKKVEEIIANTGKYVNVTTTHLTDFENQETGFKINLDIGKGAILYDVSVFAEIPKCLAEILSEEMIESDFDFEIINEDPLIKWHFDELSSAEEINYLIKKVADEDCANQMNVMPLAHKIILLTAKARLLNAIIPLLVIPIIIFMITFFSAYGFSEKEMILELNSKIKWARRMHRSGYSWAGIKESLMKTRRYTEDRVNKILEFSSNLPRLVITKLDVDIEEAIVLILIALNVLDFLKLLPGEVAYAKVIISWTVLGYILFQASITRILFGKRWKKLDIIILFGMYMLVMKNFVKIAETEFIEAGYLKDLYIFAANNAYFFETIMFMAGISIIILASMYIATRKRVSRMSFMGAVGEFGEAPKSMLRALSRFFFVFLANVFFFIVVFNLMMEWLAIAVDAALITAAIIFYLFVLIKHRKKHWLVETVYKVGNVGEKFYEQFIDLFHNRKTIFIGLTGMLMLHTLTEIGIFIIPYVLGIYNPLYFGSWEMGHMPIFNIHGGLRGLMGVESGAGSSLFMQGAAGMGLSHAGVLFLVYILNIIAILFLLTIHAVVWWHLYRHRKEPVSKVPRLMFRKFTIALFASSFTAFTFAAAFKLKGLYLRGLMGVDILTANIAQNPNLDLILAISLAVGVLVYFFSYLSKKMKSFFNWLMIVIAFVFFFNYLRLFFASIVKFYISTISTLTFQNPFVSAVLFVFMMITIVFYGFGIVFLLFELWLRNEVGLRKIIRVKELPEWMKHFDMGYIHHESAHNEKEHGEKHLMIKEYVLEEMRRKHSFSTIIMHLVSVGWSAKAIDDALHELKSNSEFRQSLRRQGKINVKAVSNLALHIRKELSKETSLKDIIKTVKKWGWSDADIVDAMLILNIE